MGAFWIDKNIGIARSNSLRQFHGDLSNKYVHANAILRPEFILSVNDSAIVIRGEPQYIEVVVPFFAEYIMRALVIALVSIIYVSFPEFQEAPNEWSERTKKFMEEVIKEIEPEDFEG